MSPKLGAKPEINQRPGGCFARRAAAEIVARDQNSGRAVFRLIERKVGILAAIRMVAPCFEREWSEFTAPMPDQTVDADHHIGVDV
jgi:hypothetical protein